MILKSYLLALAMAICVSPVFAQYGHRNYQRSYSSYSDKGKKWLQREYVSGGLPFMNLELDSKFSVNRTPSPGYSPTGPSVDTSIFLNKKCTGSYGFAVGSFFPIAKINDKQMIAIDWSFAGYIYKFQVGTVKYSPVDIVTDDAQFYVFGLPIGLVYKTGGEVSLSPEHSALFSCGAGFDPTLALGGYATAGGALFKMRTFLMAEVGAYFGIAAKIRMTWYPGIIPMINDSNEDLTSGEGYGHFAVQAYGSGNFILSLVILPYSLKWKDNK